MSDPNKDLLPPDPEVKPLKIKVGVDYRDEKVVFVVYRSLSPTEAEVLTQIRWDPEIALLVGDDLHQCARDLASHLAARGPEA